MNISLLAAEIASRIPHMQGDSVANNEQIILALLKAAEPATQPPQEEKTYLYCYAYSDYQEGGVKSHSVENVFTKLRPTQKTVQEFCDHRSEKIQRIYNNPLIRVSITNIIELES